MGMKKIYLVLIFVLCGASAASAFKINIINQTIVQDDAFRLMSSVPFGQEKLNIPPQNITLTFSKAPSTERSSIKVVDMFGTRLDDGELTTSGMNLMASLPELLPGKYTVKWTAYCSCPDQRKLSDSFRFTVKAQ
jgi:methionine-rich copper-binding protein CopC